MTNPIVLLQACTAAWLLVLAIYAVWKLSAGRGNPAFVLTCVHFIFFGVPIWLDLFVGAPDMLYPGFLNALGRPDVEIAYCAVVAVAPIIWLIVATWHSTPAPAGANRRSRTRRPMTWMEMALLLLPISLVFSVSDVDLYMSYGTATLTVLDESISSIHALVGMACMLTVATVAAVIGRTDRLTSWQVAALSSATVVALWLHGKRAILAVAALWIGYTLWRRHRASIPRLLQVASLVALTAASLLMYQSVVRGVRVGESGTYAVMRVDYGRDLILKQTVASELDAAGPRILAHRGQSFLFYATIIVPRELWPDKPWPYAVYQTSYMLSLPPTSLGWAMTTSWLDECIANLGWLGVLVGPVFLGLVCRVGDRRRDPVVEATTVVIAALFLTVQLAAFFAIFAWWCLQVFMSRGGSEAPVRSSGLRRAVRMRIRPRLVRSVVCSE